MSWQKDQRWLKHQVKRSVERRAEQLEAAGYERIGSERTILSALADLGERVLREATKIDRGGVQHERWARSEAIDRALTLLGTSDDWRDTRLADNFAQRRKDAACAKFVESAFSVLRRNGHETVHVSDHDTRVSA